MELQYKYLIYFIIINIIKNVQKTYSQTVWIDIDTGKILGVSQSQSTPNQQQQQQQNYQKFNKQNNYGNNNNEMKYLLQSKRNDYTINNSEFIIQNDSFRKNVNSEWTCRNSRTGDMLIIADKIMKTKFPEQLQTNFNNYQYQQQQQQQYNQNPWLNNNYDYNQYNQKQYQHNNNDEQSHINNEKDWKNEKISPTNIYNPMTVTPDFIMTTSSTTKNPLSPIILTTKKPFPALDNIDWTKYIDATTIKTEKSSLSDINQAINGEGIITPRFNVNDQNRT